MEDGTKKAENKMAANIMVGVILGIAAGIILLGAQSVAQRSGAADDETAAHAAHECDHDHGALDAHKCGHAHQAGHRCGNEAKTHEGCEACACAAKGEDHECRRLAGRDASCGDSAEAGEKCSHAASMERTEEEIEAGGCDHH